MKKRIGSVLLALALCLSLLPATALAEGEGGEASSVSVATAADFENALNNTNTTKIRIISDIRIQARPYTLMLVRRLRSAPIMRQYPVQSLTTVRLK